MLAKLLIGIVLLVANATDTLCTLIHIKDGGSELNPVMDALLRTEGDLPFLIAKLLLVPMLVTLLMLFATARLTFYITLPYIMVLCLHMYILFA